MADKLMIDVFIDTKKIDAQLQKIASKKVKIGTDAISSKPLDTLTKSAKTASSSMEKLASNIAHIPIKFAEWYLVAGAVTSFIGAIKTGVQGVVELDKAMTNVNFTMDLTTNEMNSLVDSSFNVAESLSTSVKEAMLANQIFSNMSATLEEVNQKTETTIALANLTGTGVSRMADSVQGIAFQFDLASDKTEELSDVMVTLAQQTGVEFSRSIQGMSDAVARAGSVAETAGFTYSEFLATISVVQEETRLAGQTIAAGVVTSLSRLSKVSDASAEEISKVEGALKRVGVQLRDSNGEFRNSYTVLEELSVVYEDLTSVEQAEIGFLIAGTRQRKIFNSIMKNMGTISERSALAMSNQGETMRLNEIYAASLEGKMNDFTNSMEKLFHTIISSDALKSLVDSGTNLVDTLTIISETFGLVNSTIAIALPLFIAFKAEAIVGLYTSLQPLIGAFAYSFVNGLKFAGVQLATMTYSVNLLKASMGLLSIAITAVIAGVSAHKRHEKELTEEIKKGNDTLKERVEKYSELNDEQKKSLELEAQETLAKTTSQLKKANEELKYSTSQYETHLKKRTELEEIQKRGIELTNTEILQLTASGKGVARNSKAMEDNKAIIEAHNLSLAILRGEVDDYVNSTNDSTDATDANTEAIGINESKYRDLITTMEDSAEVTEESELDKTEILISETKRRILAYATEMDAIEKLIKAQAGTIEGLEAEKKWMRLDVDVSEELSALDGLIKKRTELTKEEVKGAKVKAPKTYTEYELALASINRELAHTQSLNEINLKTDEDVIEVMRRKQKLLTERADVVREELKNTSLTTEETEELKDELSDLQTTYIGLTSDIKKFNSEALEEQKEKLEELSKTYKEDLSDAIDEATKKLEEQSEAEQDAYDILIKNKQQEIDDLKESNDLKEDANKLAERELELAKLKEKQANILKEKSVKRIVGGKWVFGIDEEALRENAEDIAELEKTMLEEKEKREYEARIKKLEAEKDELQNSKDAAKDNYDDRISDLKDFESEANRQIERDGYIKENLLSTVYDALREVDNKYFSDTLSGYRSMVSNINSTLGQIKSMNGGNGTAWSDSMMSEADQNRVQAFKTQYNLAKSVGDTDHMRKMNERANEIRAKYGYTGGTTGVDYASLKTGGVIEKEGFVKVHPDEALLNPAMVDRVAGGLSISGSDTAQSAKNLFNFGSGAIPNITPNNQAVTSTSESILIDKVIIEKVENVDDFVHQVRIIGRNKSR